MNKLGPFLRRKRLAKRLRQVDVAKTLHYSSQFVANWERGASYPPVQIVKDLCKLYFITKKEFMAVVMKDLTDEYFPTNKGD